MSEIIGVLRTAMTREESYQVLSSLKVKELKEVARELSVHIMQVKKSEMIERITESTVGSRLRTEAIKNTGN